MSILAATGSIPAARAEAGERAAFIRRTYTHLAGAIAAFVLLEVAVFQTPAPQALLRFLTNTRYSWLLILGGFMVLGWIARSLTAGTASPGVQYAGLGLYVVAYSVLFMPLLAVAVYIASPDVLPTAVFLTGALFLGLTAVVFTTRKDFSFLRGILTICGFVAFGLIVAAILFGFSLGLWFSVAMVAFAGAAILYDTSRILHHYPTDQHVAAALELFASVALLFWYILRIVLALRR